uniref:Uncharacterized protein n=1 Tax=Panagrolaimus superbus TaxID=310955 RepID=A0A914YE38_9BILA
MFLSKFIVVFGCIFVSFDFGNCGGTPALVSEFVYITYAGKRNFEGIAKCLNEKPLRQDATVSIWEWDPISDDFLAEQKIYNNKIDEISARFKLLFLILIHIQLKGVLPFYNYI